MTAGPLLDPDRADDAHIGRRLAEEPIIWLATTGPDGRPHNVPVWFCWVDPIVLVFALPTSLKVRHLRHNDAVALALDTAGHGTDVVLADGVAELPAEDQPGAAGTPGFVAKYAPLLAGASTVEGWGTTFRQPIRVTVTAIRAWTRSREGLHERRITADRS